MSVDVTRNESNNSSQNQSNKEVGTLYVVATPIGNMDDVSDRMRHTLQKVDRIAAEDTRRTKQLLSHIGVDTPCFSFHDHNERQKLNWLVQLLESGESVALVSDAGTPLISDPGYPLVSTLREKAMKIVAIPGPCALITALSVAGMPSDRFIFEGFLPNKSSARAIFLQKFVKEAATCIFYESSHRIKACIEDMLRVLGPDRKLVIARELTKTFETVLQGTPASLLEILNNDPNQSKGEFVVILKGVELEKGRLSDESEQLAIRLSEHLPKKLAAKITAETFGSKKNLIYDFLLDSQ
jgi:16S rRNA (cytidine1402-2'-O)-methyltransferase